jgi:hypothetical protein
MMSPIGTSRHFVAAHSSVAIGCEADMRTDALGKTTLTLMTEGGRQLVLASNVVSPGSGCGS